MNDSAEEGRAKAKPEAPAGGTSMVLQVLNLGAIVAATRRRLMIRSLVLAIALVACATADPSAPLAQTDSGTQEIPVYPGSRSPIINTSPNSALPIDDYLSLPGGVIGGAVVAGTSSSTGTNTLTDNTKSWATDFYKGRHLTDSLGYSWTITGNTATTITINPSPYPLYTIPSGAYKISGRGVYVGPTLPTSAQASDYIGGVCASELGNTCPTGYVKGDHGFFGTADGTDNDFGVIGCTDLEQVRWIHPYRPATCYGCGTGTNGCAPGADCPWSTITRVSDYGNSGNASDFNGFVRTSDLHLNPGQSLTLDGINDGNDTGRIMLVTNDSDVTGNSPHSITLTNNSPKNSQAGDGFAFPDGLDNWILPPGGKTFLMHDDTSGPNRWRLVGWGSTHYPSLTSQRLFAEDNHTATVSSCGTSPSISAGDWAATVTGGSGSPTACTVTFAQSFSSTPTCILSNQGIFESYWHSYAVTSTTLTVSSGTSAYPITKFDYICVGH